MYARGTQTNLGDSQHASLFGSFAPEQASGQIQIADCYSDLEVPAGATAFGLVAGIDAAVAVSVKRAFVAGVSPDGACLAPAAQAIAWDGVFWEQSHRAQATAPQGSAAADLTSAATFTGLRHVSGVAPGHAAPGARLEAASVTQDREARQPQRG